MADKRTLVKRDGQVKLIKSLVSKGQEIIDDETRSRNPQKEIIALVRNIRNKKTSIDELNENILNAVAVEEMDEEMRQSTDLDIMVDTELEVLESYLRELNMGDTKREGQRIEYSEENGSMDYSVNSESSESKSVKIVTQIGKSQQNTRRPRVRLPDIGVKFFSGDPTLWPEFFDYFNIAVHQNTDLSDIERFTYLKGYLHGDAKRCIQGLSLTKANYKEAVWNY